MLIFHVQYVKFVAVFRFLFIFPISKMSAWGVRACVYVSAELSVQIERESARP